MGFGLGPMEMIIIGIIAVILFGSRLPDVAKSLGKSMREFRSGMSGLDDDVKNATRPSSSSRPYESIEREQPSAPKFEPPPGEPEAYVPSDGGDAVDGEEQAM